MLVRHPLVLAAALLPVLSYSGVVHAKVTVDRARFVGKQASVSFSAEEDIKCANGSVGHVSAAGFLAGSDQMTRGTGTPKTVSNGVFVEIDTYKNSCTGVAFSFLTGGIAGGFTPPSFRLNSAALDGSTTVQDFDTGQTYPVSADVVFEGFGPLSVSRDSSKTKNVDSAGHVVSVTFVRSVATSRAADASGTVTIAGVTLSPVFSGAGLNDNSNLQIDIQR
jgi:hypothetical protein